MEAGKKQLKLTVFLVLGPLGMLYSLPMAFHSFTLTGGESLAALGYIELFGLSAMALVLDRVGTVFLKTLVVSCIEITTLFMLYLLYNFDHKELVINLYNSTSSHVIVIDDVKGLSLDDCRRAGIFNKEISIPYKEIIYINQKTFSDYSIKYRGIGRANVQHFGYKPEYNLNWTFVYDSDSCACTRQEIASLIESKLQPNQRLYNSLFHGF